MTSPELPKVFVSDRQGGKTTKLIQWLLEGKPIPTYPGWSRVIVCVNSEEVIRVTSRVRTATEDEWAQWNARVDMSRRQGEDAPVDAIRKLRHLADVRKAVWSLSDLRTNVYGNKNFEYALDNVDRFLVHLLRVGPPAIMTVTGELV